MVEHKKNSNVKVKHENLKYVKQIFKSIILKIDFNLCKPGFLKVNTKYLKYFIRQNCFLKP